MKGKGKGPNPLLLCGAFHFEHPNHFPLLHRLPRLIHISGVQGRMEQGFVDIVRLIAHESASQEPGAVSKAGVKPTRNIISMCQAGRRAGGFDNSLTGE